MNGMHVPYGSQPYRTPLFRELRRGRSGISTPLVGEPNCYRHHSGRRRIEQLMVPLAGPGHAVCQVDIRGYRENSQLLFEHLLAAIPAVMVTPEKEEDAAYKALSVDSTVALNLTRQYLEHHCYVETLAALPAPAAPLSCLPTDSVPLPPSSEKVAETRTRQCRLFHMRPPKSPSHSHCGGHSRWTHRGSAGSSACDSGGESIHRGAFFPLMSTAHRDAAEGNAGGGAILPADHPGCFCVGE